MSGPVYDVVVAGGGPAGAAAALALARSGRSVLLADAGSGPGKVGEALPPAARPLLRDLGLDDYPDGGGHLPHYANVAVWGSPSPARHDFVRDPNGHGWHLDRTRSDRQLRLAARTMGVRVLERTAVRRPVRHGDGTWTLELHPRGRDLAPAAVRCRWLLDATGRRSAIGVRRGARHRIADRLVAVHACWRPRPGTEPGDTCALVEAVPDGWWYTAPLPCGNLLVAYFTDADLAGRDAGTSDGMRALLQRTRHTRERTGGYAPDPADPPRRAPAHSAALDRPYGDGWAAVGDAVAAFDPVSAQGITTALFTGLTAARAVHAHLGGDRSALPGYASAVAAVRSAYRSNHRAVYRLEHRWPDRSFWHRRHNAGPAARNRA